MRRGIFALLACTAALSAAPAAAQEPAFELGYNEVCPIEGKWEVTLQDDGSGHVDFTWDAGPVGIATGCRTAYATIYDEDNFRAGTDSHTYTGTVRYTLSGSGDTTNYLGSLERAESGARGVFAIVGGTVDVTILNPDAHLVAKHRGTGSCGDACFESSGGWVRLP